ncbi:DUF3388 domain-containing protein [Aneurinibacillus sp. Ricciae_BoGa-3]|uniref:DUF3388 domain-containing protein n=1 Tax=Aneurinibacillus sp. Ricciae_BoGa-3 TaxID=3022697 RepID=UPI0023411D7B|nr:DUF3388 domain-containing protein [Aneurinibacillus sp. Ricciae_BoGa-3]WCK56139.1 DUF3388 domain-containing protein [Aneurinibacillus sp. Ricciae_BoGa-3]
MSNQKQDWYLEYEVHNNRPGLLGDVASILGMLSINIVTINGVESIQGKVNRRRGLLIRADDAKKIELLGSILEKVESISLRKLRQPTILDLLAVRHGRYIERDSEDKRTFRFIREEIGVLVDFMAEIFKREGNQLVGIRGMPRVGKTESTVAACVSANRRWTFISSTLIRQTVRNQLTLDEMGEGHVYLIDGIVSTMRSTEKHAMLMREIMRMPYTKVIEHPDVFVRETEYNISDFDYIIELRNDPDEEITYENIETGFSGFDLP